MERIAQKAYETYREIAKTSHLQVTTAKLNILYNIQCRMKRDEAYRTALDALTTEEGEVLSKLIESYFTAYNARHGLEIRDTLTEFLQDDFVQGGYFRIDTYKKVGDERIPCDATAFSVGDAAIMEIRLFSRATDTPIVAEAIRYIVKTDDGEVYEASVEQTDRLAVECTLSRPGWVYVKANAVDAEGKNWLGFDTAFGGILFDFTQIPLTKESPADLYDFWDRAVDRLMAVNPTDETPDGYDGLVAYEYDMPAENHFKLVKFDAAFVQKLRDYGIVTFDERVLEAYDFYEVNLKAPGPCHSSNYLSIPKGKEPGTLPLHVIFDGYSAYPLYPSYTANAICLHCSHHGYSLPNSLEGYYMKLRNGVCRHYGLGDGSVNSMYEDLNDNYMLYLHLRNLQAIRFVTDPALSAMIPSLHTAWSGQVKLQGGSMGGYQAICTAGLSTFLEKKSAPYQLIHVTANIPAFCNLAGRTDGRVPCMTYYTDGMEYFDAAHLAGFVHTPIDIPRVGLGDTTCSPNGIVAMFNHIPAGIRKEIHFLQNSDHGTLPEAEKQMWSRYTYA